MGFLAENVREDGSWPIDTNLATWVTTLAINALGNDAEFKFEEKELGPVRDWILDQQYTEIHPYTNAAPGGWAWTDLTGGVPDADDTAGAMLALNRIRGVSPLAKHQAAISVENAASLDPLAIAVVGVTTSEKVSAASTTVSPIISTATLATVWPARKVTEPERAT